MKECLFSESGECTISQRIQEIISTEPFPQKKQHRHISNSDQEVLGQVKELLNNKPNSQKATQVRQIIGSACQNCPFGEFLKPNTPFG